MKTLGFLLLLITAFCFSFTKSAAPVVGDTAPEIRLVGQNGDTVQLSDLRGKVVLIDFWASWCGPCRQENPNVVEVYNKYNKTKFKTGKGFEVFSVSLDRSEKPWKDAIVKDGLIWKNHGWDNNNTAAREYGVAFIPTAFLIDGKGKIVATGESCRGINLYVQLDKLKK